MAAIAVRSDHRFCVNATAFVCEARAMAPAMHLVLFRLQQQLRCPFLAPNVSIAKRFSPSIERPNLCSQFVAGAKHASWRRRSLGAAAAVVAHQQTPAAVVERHHHSATPAAAVFANGFQTGIGELEFGKVLRVGDDESCCTLNKPETEEEKKDGLSLPPDSATMESKQFLLSLLEDLLESKQGVFGPFGRFV